MPVQVDVFSPLPESWGMCLSCEMLMARANFEQAPDLRGQKEYPTEWQEDFQRLSDLVSDLSQRFGESVSIRLYDPRSMPGLLKAIRHGVHRYPTFIVSGREKITGWNLPELEQRLLQAGASTGNESRIEAKDER